MSIEIRNIEKRFGDFKALDQVSLDIGSGELIALLGPSGCGKTTLLRIIAGLESADEGSILFSGEDTTHVHVRERHVGFVFQHYALFRHMSVFDNVAFGLKVRPKSTRPSDQEIKERVHALLNLVQLDWLADRYPSQLSGGQRQRIALARALAVEPKVLLLDEPFGALDAKVRKELRRWLRRLHDDLHITTIFVTHDQEEALEVADRVVVMNKGKIEQSGSPQEVWDHPASPFVYGFLGDVNLFHGRVHEGETQLGDHNVRLSTPELKETIDAKAMAYVRPYEIEVRRPEGWEETGIIAELTRAIVVGPIARLEFVPQNQQSTQIIEAHIPAGEFKKHQYREGETLILNPKNARVFVQPNSTS